MGVIVVFIPPLDIGWRVMKKMEEPAKVELDKFYRDEYAKKAKQAEKAQSISPTVQALVDAEAFFGELSKYAPELKLPQGEALRGKTLNLPMRFFEAGLIRHSGTLDRSDRPELGLARAAGNAHDLLRALSRGGVGARQSLGLLPGLGVCGGRVVPARAALREEISALFAGALPHRRVSLFLLRAAAHAPVPASVQRLAGRGADACG